MKAALGLFHFNPHWGLNPQSSHRHVSEALLPFLQAVHQHPRWNTSLEISGSGLEMIEKMYPNIMKLLRRLVDNGQIELISPLYTPSVWVAFPRSDLVRSVLRNRQCLDGLRLPWSRLFFAQEGFFGQGVQTLGDYFDIAICKDDYLNYFYKLDPQIPAYNLGDLQLIVASGHLLELSVRRLDKDPVLGVRSGFSARHYEHLQQGTSLNDGNNFPTKNGHWNGVEWLWYHCGDGNHFSCIAKPDNLDQCYRDDVWAQWCASMLNELIAGGYELSSISEFAHLFDKSSTPCVPPLLEGSWNSKKSEGVYTWMGGQTYTWQNHAAVLSRITRARQRLSECEERLRDDDVASSPVRDQLQQGWDALLHAQISDALGWYPTQSAVSYSLMQSDRALSLGNQILSGLDEKSDAARNRAYCPCNCEPAVPILPMIPFGGSATQTVTAINRDHQAYEVSIVVEDGICGVRFEFAVPFVGFCPSGLESEFVMINRETLKPCSVVLPLANGLLQISEDIFLIKETAFVHVAARIYFGRREVEFAVQASPPKARLLWRFRVLRCTAKEAICVANDLNLPFG